MAHLFATPEWTAAYKDAVNANEGYKIHGKPWTFGAVAFVVKADPSVGIEQDTGMIMDVHEGECRDTKLVHGMAAAEEAPFVVVADYARWKQCLRGELDPIKSMMEGKLKLTKGHLPTMLRFVESSRQLVVSATNVDTKFADE